MRPPVLRLHVDGLVVDNFAGGGGASTGIEWALGRSPDIAVNHDPEAVAMHRANHPGTRHFCEDVFKVHPKRVCGNRKVALAWFSPDCTFHSNARGGKPFRDPESARGRRGLAGVVIHWAQQVKPRVIILENVAEFADWGPLDEDGRPDPDRKGQSFRNWLGKLKAQGYEVDMRLLRGCDYGAPTIRKRLFLVARCDGKPIVWPEPTHGPGRAHPYRVAAECIDWSIPVRSIFGRKKPLAEPTMRRIAHGLRRFVLESGDPFLIPLTHAGDARVHSIREPMRTITAAHRGEHALVAPTLIQTGYGERPGQSPRVPGLDKPFGTVMATGQKHALVGAFLAKHYGNPDRRKGGGAVIGSQLSMPLGTVTTKDHHSLVATHMVKLRGTCADGQDWRKPAPTICAGGNHVGEVRAFLVKYYRTGIPASLKLPFDTVTTKPRFGLVTVAGEEYVISDIGMRMVEPPELFRAQGFEASYRIDVEVSGKPLTKEAQVRMCGNSVNPDVACALVLANLAGEQAVAA